MFARSSNLFRFTSNLQFFTASRFFASIKCTSCETVHPPTHTDPDHVCSFFCSKCSSLLPFDKTKCYYDLLSVPAPEHKFTMDLEKLQKTYYSKQSLIHPDKFANSSESERELASLHSTLLNRAFFTLKNPISRAEYILTKAGILSPDDVKESDAFGFDMGPDFLMQVLELNEDFEMIDRLEDLLIFEDKIYGHLKENFDLLKPLLDDPDNEAAKSAALPVFLRIRYFSNLENKCKEKRVQFLSSSDIHK